MKKHIPTFILLIGSALLVGIGVRTSMNRTEVAHFGAAAYFWQTAKFDLFHVNPPAGRIIAGLPMLLCRPDYDWSPYSERPRDRSEWAVGTALIHANPPEKVRWMLILGRCAFIPFIFLGGLVGSRFAADIYGYGAGIVFAILWSFSPLVLGWGATQCPDMLAASLGVIALAWFWHWTRNPTWSNVAWAGVGIGLLPLTKLTWVIAFLLFPLLWILAVKRPSWKQMAVVMLIALYILNMGYLFDGSFRPLKEYTFLSEALGGPESLENQTANRFADSVLGRIPVPLPKEFVLGIDTQKRDFERGLESYLLGVHSDRGCWWYYYFVVLFLKEPIGTLLLVGLSVYLLATKRECRANWNDELFVILPFLTLFCLVSVQDGIAIHPRYLLPAMPFFYLFASRSAKAFSLSTPYYGKTVVIALTWMVLSSLIVYPYSMSYFNEMIPQKNRPNYLLGSNIDWGQDAYFLKSWLEKHPEASPIRIAYPCPETIERIGIRSAGDPSTQRQNGWFALGVNDLYAASKQYSWLLEEKPVAVVGYSIYVYHILPDQLEPE